MRTRTPRTSVHHDWIGMIQPEGLVVSAAVLDDLELYVRQPPEVHAQLRELTPGARLPDLGTLLHGVLGWRPERVVAPPEDLRVDLPDLGVTLAPTHLAVDPRGRTVLLLQHVDGDVDGVPSGDRWPASRTDRFVRLLVSTGHPTGLLVSGDAIRLVHAPAGQAPGWLTFRLTDLHETDGRLLVDALLLLLGSAGLFNAPAGKSLADVLTASRERQENVTEQLAGQVEDALRLLLAGFDDADERTRGALLSGVDDDVLYDGLTTVLLRLVFLLYAEDRGLLPMDHPVYAQHYSVLALGEQLAADRVAHGEAQARRFGAWARLLSLFRMVWGGARADGLDLPARQGDLFDPNRFPFLEGRPPNTSHEDPVRVPPVDDAVLAGVLDHLLHLDGQRVSFRNLEVEQIGSVYEAMMGFVVRRAVTEAVPLKGGALVELGDLADATTPVLHLADVLGERAAKLREDLPALATWTATGDALADRAALAELLGPRRDGRRASVPAGRHYLQPGEARRRSGSHYTPRQLTEPLVRRTLDPLLGPTPTPEQILALRVVDPAMGSGAFLAEACRQLAERLVEAWGRTGTLPPGRHDPLLVARRMVSERCLYGVDKNPRAVQLARLSLWLVTSAADLPFTFVDHLLREGDALVGLDVDQIAAFDLRPDPAQVRMPYLKAAMSAASRTRTSIADVQQSLALGRQGHGHRRHLLQIADEETWDERRVGDVLVACLWAGGGKKELEKRRLELEGRMGAWYPNPEREPLPDAAQAVLDGLPLRPFHWALEFPEVFGRKAAGFDAVIGNPPFGGSDTIRKANGGADYIKLLQALWPHAHGNSDLCAYFFLRMARVLRKGGTFGLVATNTLSQGDTLDTGLRHLMAERDLSLFHVERDKLWPVPGAAVVVHTLNGIVGKAWDGARTLDGVDVLMISSSLTAGEELPRPVALRANAAICFEGTKVYGQGFVLTPDEAHALIAEDPRNAEVIKPYLGGQELNSNVPETPDGFIPHDRYVIDFGDRSLAEAREWPKLIEIVERLVKPEREQNNRENYRRLWWQFGERRPGLLRALDGLRFCLVWSRHAKHLNPIVMPVGTVFSEALDVVAIDDWCRFSVLQSRCHELWARLLGSSMKTDLRYTPSTCFETFPFPRPTSTERDFLASTGEALQRARRKIMVREQIGMTKVWNRLHDPHDHDPAIVELRALRDAMDRAVLDAYGWSDLSPDDGPQILTRLRALNAARAAEEAAAAAESGKSTGKKRRKG